MRPETCARKRLGEAELVEQESGDDGGAVGIEQAAFGARRGQPLVHALHAERRRQRGEAQIERHELDFDAALLLLVGEGLLDAVEAAFVGKLVVFVVGVSEPEPDRLDAAGLHAVFAAARDLGLVHVDAGVGLGRFEPRHAIEAREARHRDADKSLVEDVGAADRLSVGAHRRIRLPAVERQRLVARRQIRVTRNAVVVGAPSGGVGVEGEVARAGVEDDRAVEAVVDCGAGAAHLVFQARCRRHAGGNGLGRKSVRLRLRQAGQGIRDSVVAGVDHAADRLRTPAQRRRSSHHFNSLGRQRVQRHGMVLAELRHAAGSRCRSPGCARDSYRARGRSGGWRRRARSSSR